MLEFDDIQYILVTRVPALTGRYEFLSFREPAQGRAWLEAIREKVPSAKAVVDTVNLERRWVSVALTWNGLRALGMDEASLATFPEEFRKGMAARWQVIGDTGTNHPDNWVGSLAGPKLHAIAILFARDAADRDRSAMYANILATATGSRPPKSRERGLCRHQALDRRSRNKGTWRGKQGHAIPHPRHQ